MSTECGRYQVGNNRPVAHGSPQTTDAVSIVQRMLSAVYDSCRHATLVCYAVDSRHDASKLQPALLVEKTTSRENHIKQSVKLCL